MIKKVWDTYNSRQVLGFIFASLTTLFAFFWQRSDNLQDKIQAKNSEIISYQDSLYFKSDLNHDNSKNVMSVTKKYKKSDRELFSTFFLLAELTNEKNEKFYDSVDRKLNEIKFDYINASSQLKKYYKNLDSSEKSMVKIDAQRIELMYNSVDTILKLSNYKRKNLVKYSNLLISNFEKTVINLYINNSEMKSTIESNIYQNDIEFKKNNKILNEKYLSIEKLNLKHEITRLYMWLIFFVGLLFLSLIWEYGIPNTEKI